MGLFAEEVNILRVSIVGQRAYNSHQAASVLLGLCNESKLLTPPPYTFISSFQRLSSCLIFQVEIIPVT